MDNEKFQDLVLKKLDLLDTMQGDITNLNINLVKVETRLDNLASKVDKIDAGQVRMETELTEKVRALFDAREVQNDVNERIISALERIEAKVDVLQLETAHLRRVK